MSDPTPKTRHFNCSGCGFSQVVPAHFPPVVCPICRHPEKPPATRPADSGELSRAAPGSVSLPTPHSPPPTI